MSRLTDVLLVVAVWAGIYLPALGSFEIRGEEGRRIFPAIAMLDSGNYLVPKVGGDVYTHKPPLINWLIAGSFRVFGKQNEWTARVPSVVSVLLVAIAFITIARKTLTDRGSLAAALVWLTNFGTLGKGRVIEIEALYMSLSALAMICWLSWWREQRSPWLTWFVPWIFLGLGWLAKGPTHLFFFYALVCAVLWQAGQLRLLARPIHILAILLMLGIFAAWAIPFVYTEDTGKVVATWSTQLTGRVTGQFFRPIVWLTSLPRALGYFLPWLIFVPLIRLNKLPQERDRQLARALTWSVVVPLVVVSLIPGSAPRYSLPVLTPFCWLLAMVFAQDAFADLPWLRFLGGPLWRPTAGLFITAAVLGGTIGFPIAAAAAKRHEKIRSVADVINHLVPPNEKLYAVDPNFQPFLFYVHATVKYVLSVEELPYETRYFLVRPENEAQAASLKLWSPRQPKILLKKTDYRDETVVLFMVDSG